MTKQTRTRVNERHGAIAALHALPLPGLPLAPAPPWRAPPQLSHGTQQWHPAKARTHGTHLDTTSCSREKPRPNSHRSRARPSSPAAAPTAAAQARGGRG